MEKNMEHHDDAYDEEVTEGAETSADEEENEDEEDDAFRDELDGLTKEDTAWSEEENDEPGFQKPFTEDDFER